MAAALGLVATTEARADRGGPPPLTASAAVLVDGRDGHVLYRRAASRRRAIASTTKLMTALIALERLPSRRRLTAPVYNAGAAESRIGLRPGERMAVADLMRALLLESANDAAVTLARGVAGSVPAFVTLMNARAAELGLARTHYANPVGLDERGNYSTALDLARLARRLLENDTFATIVDLPSARLRTGARPRVVDNRNDLVARVPWVDGVKTGHTLDAGYVLIGAGTRKGVRLVSVVLGEPSQALRDTDTLALLEYGFSRYRRVRPLTAGAEVAATRVAHFGGRLVPLTVRRDVRLTVRRGERVRTVTVVPPKLDGPIARGARVGEVRVYQGRRLARLVPLVTAEAVPRAGVGRRLGAPLAALAAVAALAAMLRLAARRGFRGG
jgi:serine-type D-Ala-D-Ala carboxypeptidase (penicillin-binding protein 5/6)